MEDERKAAIEDAARQAVPAQAPPLWQAALDAAAMIGTYRWRDEPPRKERVRSARAWLLCGRSGPQG